MSKSWINGASLGQSDGRELFRIELSENDQFQTHISVTFQNKDYTETDCSWDRPSVINRMRVSNKNLYSEGIPVIMGATINMHLFLEFENYAKTYFRKGLNNLRKEHTEILEVTIFTNLSKIIIFWRFTVNYVNYLLSRWGKKSFK